jgi:hypothetical protein
MFGEGTWELLLTPYVPEHSENYGNMAYFYVFGRIA